MKNGLSKSRSVNIYFVNSDEATQITSTSRSTRIPARRRCGRDRGSTGDRLLLPLPFDPLLGILHNHVCTGVRCFTLFFCIFYSIVPMCLSYASRTYYTYFTLFLYIHSNVRHLTNNSLPFIFFYTYDVHTVRTVYCKTETRMNANYK